MSKWKKILSPLRALSILVLLSGYPNLTQCQTKNQTKQGINCSLTKANNGCVIRSSNKIDYWLKKKKNEKRTLA